MKWQRQFFSTIW